MLIIHSVSKCPVSAIHFAIPLGVAYKKLLRCRRYPIEGTWTGETPRPQPSAVDIANFSEKKNPFKTWARVQKLGWQGCHNKIIKIGNLIKVLPFNEIDGIFAPSQILSLFFHSNFELFKNIEKLVFGDAIENRIKELPLPILDFKRHGNPPPFLSTEHPRFAAANFRFG